MKTIPQINNQLSELVTFVDEGLKLYSLPLLVTFLQEKGIDHTKMPLDVSYRVKYRFLHCLISEHTQHVVRIQPITADSFLQAIASEMKNPSKHSEELIVQAGANFWNAVLSKWSKVKNIDENQNCASVVTWVELTNFMVAQEYYFGFQWHTTPDAYWRWVYQTLQDLIIEEERSEWNSLHPAA